jgi:hypothetical protein
MFKRLKVGAGNPVQPNTLAVSYSYLYAVPKQPRDPNRVWGETDLL